MSGARPSEEEEEEDESPRGCSSVGGSTILIMGESKGKRDSLIVYHLPGPCVCPTQRGGVEREAVM